MYAFTCMHAYMHEYAATVTIAAMKWMPFCSFYSQHDFVYTCTHVDININTCFTLFKGIQILTLLSLQDGTLLL